MVLSVSQLNGYIAKMLYGDTLLRALDVAGEVTNLRGTAYGKYYFSLKDDNALIDCVADETVGNDLEEGQSIVASGAVGCSRASSRYTLYVESIASTGSGEQYARLEELKHTLFAQGLFDASRKRALPGDIRKVGVVTSASGAVIHDIITVAKRRSAGAEILLYASRVQGEGAAQEITEGIAYFNAQKSVDVIIVGRGGGSFEDLSPYNDESVVRAVVASDIPIVSAVGHEIDITLCDLAADIRAATPSVAAELCFRDRAELANEVKQRRLLIKSAMSGYLERKSALLEQRRALLSALDPSAALRRGFAIVRRDGAILRTVEDAEPDGTLEVTLADGSFEAVVRGRKDEKDV